MFSKVHYCSTYWLYSVHGGKTQHITTKYCNFYYITINKRNQQILKLYLIWHHVQWHYNQYVVYFLATLLAAAGQELVRVKSFRLGSTFPGSSASFLIWILILALPPRRCMLFPASSQLLPPSPLPFSHVLMSDLMLKIWIKALNSYHVVAATCLWTSRRTSSGASSSSRTNGEGTKTVHQWSLKKHIQYQDFANIYTTEWTDCVRSVRHKEPGW